jgi:uncharacterized phage protein (TIGR01671 family)
MREIKFRAWDSFKKRMLYNYLFVEQREGYVSANVVAPTTHRITDVMQFTGLHDKNGKEIYEGDIIEGNLIRWSPLAPMGTIEYSNVDCCFGNKNDGGFTHLYEIDGIQVIGNTRENEDLIKP